MGLQDRQYYQDSYSSPFVTGSTGGRSMVTILIVINVAIFVADMFFPVISSILAMHPNELPLKFWQFVTYGFAHAPMQSKESFFHVGGNMLVLFFLGRPVEMRLGKEEFLKFYLVAILIAGLGYFLLNVGSPMPMVGASGAVSAVVALFIFLYPKQTLLLMGVIPMPAWVLGVIVVGMDLLRSMDPKSVIAWEAHLAGFFFGAAYFYFNWNFSFLKTESISKALKQKPNLKVHRPNKLDRIREEGEAILEKINLEGEDSLTAKERKVLKQYSQQLRDQRD